MLKEAIDVLGPIITGEDIKAELRRRRSPRIFKTVSASKPDLLKSKVELEEADGWTRDKKNKSSYRMSRFKPADEQLEDRVWCIFANMGFPEMSLGRHFQIDVGKDIPPRQIDVFAKDDETVLLVECTQSETPKSKSMMTLIEKLMAIREGIQKSIVQKYGKENKLKFKVAIATYNIEWKQVDIDKCREAQIAVLDESELNYYEQLVQFLRTAARFQLLGHLFGGAGISGLSREVAATQGKMGGTTFYNFLIRPDELLKIAYVGHKASRRVEDIDTYQRMLQPKRLKDIAAFIDDGGKFPTNIVVNIKTKDKKKLRFDKKEQVLDAAYGTLHLPNNYASAWVIDGQHRLYGYAYAEKHGGTKDKTTLPVLAFENLDATDEMELFIDINSKQVNVKTSLLVELYADLHWDSPDVEERFAALLARVGATLNSKKTSPLFDRVIVTGKKKTSSRCLTQTSISAGLHVSRLLGSVNKSSLEAGPFSVNDVKDTKASLNKAVEVLIKCFTEFSAKMPTHWNAGDGQGGYLATNIGIRALMLVFKDICDHIQNKSGQSCYLLNADELFTAMKPLLDPLAEYFAKATSDEIASFRRIGSSLALVQMQARGMEAIIRKSIVEFNPAGLKEYMESRDVQGTEEAAAIISNIQRKMFNYVMKKIKENFGEDKNHYWVKGIPGEIRKKISKLWEDEDRIHSEESYLHLIDYIDIATHNWKYMSAAFSLGHKDKDNRKECLKWLSKLNEIRNTTHHPEKGVLSTDQVNFVKDINNKVKEYFSE